MSVLGLDIGGANLKAAHPGGVRVQPFELWKHPDRLADALRTLLHALPPCSTLAVTMTGELCDCFATKRDGVHAILDATESAADTRRLLIWTNAGAFVPPAAARAAPLTVAAANWLALATFAGRLAPEGHALVIDTGSTTTDVVPLESGRPTPHGRTDPERLRERELVYTGARRTPVCALLDGDGAAEFFATTHDVHLLLGHLPEDAADRHTADGRPATRAGAQARLARMCCADAETGGADLAQAVALRAYHKQRDQIGGAVRHVLSRWPTPPAAVILAGSGEFLARLALAQVPEIAAARRVSLGDTLGPERSAAACAHAVAVLAGERGHA